MSVDCTGWFPCSYRQVDMALSDIEHRLAYPLVNALKALEPLLVGSPDLL
jgi:hypothetical protein